jgi:hypothetical protein
MTMNLSVPRSEDNISTTWATIGVGDLKVLYIGVAEDSGLQGCYIVGPVSTASRYLGTPLTAHPETHHHTLRVKNF